MISIQIILVSLLLVQTLNMYLPTASNYNREEARRYLLVHSQQWKHQKIGEICSKSTIKKEERYMNRYEPMNRSRTFFWCFHYWLWLSKCQLGRNQTRNLLPVLHFIKKSTRNKKVIFYIIYLSIYKIYKYIFFASPVRVQEFISS